MINNADSFPQPLIIFTKGANHFGHDFMFHLFALYTLYL